MLTKVYARVYQESIVTMYTERYIKYIYTLKNSSKLLLTCSWAEGYAETLEMAIPFVHPPQLWSVYNSIETGVPRTQNIAETRWGVLAIQSYIGVYTMIKELQKEQRNVDFQVEWINCGEQPQSRNHHQERRPQLIENRIMTVI